MQEGNVKTLQRNLDPVTGKLITPLLNNSKSTEISSLFGKESWRLLHLCGIKGRSFLKKTASSWEDDSDYKMLENIVKNLVVVNGVTESSFTYQDSPEQV